MTKYIFLILFIVSLLSCVLFITKIQLAANASIISSKFSDDNFEIDIKIVKLHFRPKFIFLDKDTMYQIKTINANNTFVINVNNEQYQFLSKGSIKIYGPKVNLISFLFETIFK